MAADITVFDPNTIIDHATYENPALPSEGVRHVVVNGRVALKDGAPTGARGGQRAVAIDEHAEPPADRRPRSLKGQGARRGQQIAIDLTQRAGAREATGAFAHRRRRIVTRLGMLQTTHGWASVGFDNGGRAISATIDHASGSTVDRDGRSLRRDGTRFRGAILPIRVEIK